MSRGWMISVSVFMAVITCFSADELFAGRGGGMGGSRSSSSGSWGSRSSSFSRPAYSRPAYTPPVSRPVYTPPVRYTPPRVSTPSPVRTVPVVRFDSAATQAARRQESAARYRQANPPVRTPQVVVRPVVNQPAVRNITNVTNVTRVNNVIVPRVTYRSYGYNPSTWATSHRTYYARYYAPNYRPRFYVRAYYHDPIDTFFWYSLLEMSAESQARWAYNHQAELDAQRIADLRASNAAFAVEYQKLLAEKARQDLNYQLANVPPSQVYSEAYLKQQAELAARQAAAQAAVVPVEPAPTVNTVVPLPQPASSEKQGSSHWFLWLCLALVVLFVLASLRVW